MKINGSLVFDGSSASEIQNLRLQKVTALPTIEAADVGRLVYNSNTNIIYVGSSGAQGALSWVPLATGGDASALLAEVDRIETSLGLNTDGSFDGARFTGTLANQTSYAGLITTLQGLAAAATDAAAAEAQRATAAEAAIGTRIDDEVADLEAAAATEATRVNDALAAEVTRATGIEGTLRTDLTAETAARVAGDTALGGRIDGIQTAATAESTRIEGLITAETTRATGEEGRIEDLVEAEAAARAAGDTANADAIAAEVTRATAAEAALGGRITTEVTDRTAAINTVTTALADEVTRATAAEGTLTTDLAAEVTRAIAQETAIRNELASAIAGLTWEAPVNFMVTDHTTVTGQAPGTRVLDLTNNTIYTVTADGFDAGEALVDGAAFFFTVDDTGYVFNGTSVVQFNGAAGITAGTGLVKTGNVLNIVSDTGTITVTADSIDVSAGVLGSITTVGTNLAAEVTRATAAEEGLGDRITDEAADRAAAITAEVSRVDGLLATERSERIAGDDGLTARIDGLETTISNGNTANADALAGEVARATAEEARLAGLITAETTARGTAITDAIAAEVTARDAAIAAEATARTTAAATEAARVDAAIAAEADRAEAAETAITGRLDKMYFLYEGLTPATSHTVTHNLGVRYCNVTVVDETDNVVIPESIVFTSANALTVTFNSLIACRVVVMGLASAV